MPIDVEKYRTILKELEGELLASLEKSEVDARETASAEVEDQIDQANTDMSKDLVLDEESRDYDKLRMVREALERVDAGTFGVCVDCGREIPEARLQAVPWAAYCVEDQEKREPKFTPATL
jgi:DnaK suppressor protein